MRFKKNIIIIIIIIIIQKIAPLAEPGKYFQIWFFPRFGGENGGVLSMRMQVILDSLFARPGSAPIGGGKKGEFRDWTRRRHVGAHPDGHQNGGRKLKETSVTEFFLKA